MKTDTEEKTGSNENDNENKSEETLDEIMKSQDLEDIIRENSGLFCNFCPWGPAKTKKGLITHRAKMHSNLYFKRTKKWTILFIWHDYMFCDITLGEDPREAYICLWSHPCDLSQK